MKHFLLLISLVFSVNCFAQEPDPDLFQTWYLESFYVSDGAPNTIVVSEIHPSISPTLVIDSDFQFTGMAACNSYSGNFNPDGPDGFTTEELLMTDMYCGVEAHTSFEDSFFNYLQFSAGYYIETYEDGLKLHLQTQIFGSGTFTNNPLNTSNFEFTEFEIFPNPATDKIKIKSQDVITKVEVYSLEGKKMLTFNSQSEDLTISKLPSGIYILKIFSEGSSLNKRFIKK